MTPPVTKATTITTTDNTGQTIAIAVGVGAGVVGAGALAAWLFKPVPGAPPAPTTPPPYSTASQPSTTDDPPTTTDDPTSTTSDENYSCPFTKVDATAEFTSVPVPPKWTGDIPQQTVSYVMPSCTPQGSNNQLLRGTDPGYVKELAGVFCKNDLSKDQSETIGQKDLPNDSQWKNSELDGIRAKFDFKFAAKHDDCPQNCVDSYNRMVGECKLQIAT